ncbi:hypothetical protein V501_02654, partial [Pseudogymnoascus sp. VKM F-4519 (FW-2642)]
MNVAFFSYMHYDQEAFDEVNKRLGNPLKITYLASSLNELTVPLANGHSAICLFVNDNADAM